MRRRPSLAASPPLFTTRGRRRPLILYDLIPRPVQVRRARCAPSGAAPRPPTCRPAPAAPTAASVRVKNGDSWEACEKIGRVCVTMARPEQENLNTRERK